MQQVRCIGFSLTTWNMKRLLYLNYIGKDGTWNFTLNGLSNTFTSNPLWNFRECHISANLDCHMHILALAYAKKVMHIDQSLHTISKNVGLFLTDKTPLNELFNKAVPTEETEDWLYPSLSGPMISKRDSSDNTYYILRNQINRASILSVRGFYGKAESLLQSLNPDEMPYQLKLYYYFTFAWIYNYWESYAKNSDYAEEFRAQKKHYMTLLIQSFNENSKKSAYYQYLMGEYAYFNNPTSKESLNHYQKALKMSPAKSRIHAMSAYGIARYYKKTANSTFTRNSRRGIRERWIVPAQRNDCASKLAYYIFKRMRVTVRELPNISSTRWKMHSSSTTNCA